MGAILWWFDSVLSWFYWMSEPLPNCLPIWYWDENFQHRHLSIYLFQVHFKHQFVFFNLPGLSNSRASCLQCLLHWMEILQVVFYYQLRKWSHFSTSRSFFLHTHFVCLIVSNRHCRYMYIFCINVMIIMCQIHKTLFRLRE
jgi:hypothetical protein